MVIIFILLLLIFGQPGFSQIAINASGSTADPSAMLDIYAIDKGLLIPRVSLSGAGNSNNPINNPAIGLLVYNKDGNDLTPGIYMWTGSIWASLPTMEQVQNAMPGPNGPGVFGEMYEYNSVGNYSTITITGSGSYITWNNATLGEIAAMSYDSTWSTLIIENSGIYKVAFHSVAQLPVSGKIIEAALFVNGNQQDDLHDRTWCNGANEPHELSFSGFITLYSDDLVTVRYTINDSGIIRIEIVNLSLVKID